MMLDKRVEIWYNKFRIDYNIRVYSDAKSSSTA
jgi:hypothetical protein